MRAVLGEMATLVLEGRRVFETIGAPAKKREAQLFGGIDAAELARFEQTIDKLLGKLSEAE